MQRQIIEQHPRLLCGGQAHMVDLRGRENWLRAGSFVRPEGWQTQPD